MALTWSRRMRSMSDEIVIDERRRLGCVGALLDLVPEMNEEAQVGAELFFRRALGGGADDEAAGGLAALVDQNPLEALALFVGRDLAADADVGDGGHEDQEAAGQGDVRGDARALLGDGLLGDLDQNLLAGLEQVADDGQIGGLHGAARGAAALALAGLRPRRASASAATAAATAIAALRVLEPAPAAGWPSGCFGFFVLVFVVEASSSPLLSSKFNWMLVVEVRLLQHLAQVAGANLRGQRLLFFVIVQIVLVVAW